MFKLFSRPKKHNNVPEQIYGMVVAQARNPKLFMDFELPDTVMGRFEILALHVFLLSRRLKQEESETALSLSQDVFDLFVADVDRALRELGIGDTSVPKRKKKMIRSFYGQIEDFDAVLNDGDTELLGERTDNRFYEGESREMGARLAGYISEVSEILRTQAFETIRTGAIIWPSDTISKVG